MNKNGEVRVIMDKIEKGILRNGISFKSKNYEIALKTGNLEGVSMAGFQDFIMRFGELIGKEIAGYYFTDLTKDGQEFAVIGKYERNTRTESYPPIIIRFTNP